MIRKKILLLGDFSVGKTSLIQRYIDKSFSDMYLTTIGVKVSKKLLETKSGIEVELIVWDIEGTTKSKSIPTSYYTGASGAIFVADISRNETVESLEKEIVRFLEVNPNAVYIVAHNKSDLIENIKEKEGDLKEYHFFTSAKDDYNVDTVFSELLERIVL